MKCVVFLCEVVISSYTTTHLNLNQLQASSILHAFYFAYNSPPHITHTNTRTQTRTYKYARTWYKLHYTTRCEYCSESYLDTHMRAYLHAAWVTQWQRHFDVGAESSFRYGTNVFSNCSNVQKGKYRRKSKRASC